MKTPLLLLASCLLLLVAVVVSTPVDTSNLETARQAPGGGKPPAASTDDDDDDDDDDDIDLDITDDDDDDDDDDEAEDDDDDDDEDFFERFFDDILGDDDDDDDDDDTPTKPAATPAASPVAAATQQKPVAPVISASVDYPSLDYNTAPGETAETADPSAAPLAAYDEAVPEEQAGFASDDVAESAAALDASTPDLVQKPSDVAAAASTDDDEDDDDDDDDEELDVTLDDDDDDDDEDEDDEDDEDDDDDDDDDLSDVVGDDVIEAKRSRALENNPATSMYITKYNRFVDNILERINRILRKNYDPVNVRLHTNNEKKGNGKNSGHKKNKNRRRRPGRRPHRTSPVARATTEVVEATMNESLAAISAQLTEALQETTLQEMNDTLTTTIAPTTKRSSGGNSRAQPQNNKNKNKNNSGKNRPNAKATLYGLSTMKREDDVTVNMMSSHTTVRTKFTVGPLILRVEKEFGRGAKKDIRSATATTTEMTGKMNLRVMHGGAATLHSIRVMQPKQVRVESSDDHDKTREYIWKRSSHIARVVSQKLTNATKSMLQPPPMPANGVFA